MAKVQYSIRSLYVQRAVAKNEYDVLMRDEVFTTALARALNNNRFTVVSGLSNNITRDLNLLLDNPDIYSQVEGIFRLIGDNLTPTQRTRILKNLQDTLIIFTKPEEGALNSSTLLLLGFTGTDLERQIVPPAAMFTKEQDVFGGGQVPTYTGADLTIFAITPDVFTLLPTMKTISYSTHVDKTHVRVLGRSTPKGQTDGYRTVAGSMIHTITVNDPMMPLHPEWFSGAVDDIHTVHDIWKPYFATDQIPMFDLILFFSNELGYASTMGIFGIQIPQTGQVISMADSEIEITYTYTALDVEILRGVQYRKSSRLTSTGGNEEIYTLDIMGMNEYTAVRNRIMKGYSLHTSPYEAPAIWAKIQNIYEELDFMKSSRYAGKDRSKHIFGTVDQIRRTE